MACFPTEAKYGYDDSRFEKAVDDHFHCSICYNVLKEPMMCRNNEHLFCRDCITEHLNTNSHTCPECNEDLTVETLRRARVISNILSGLKIKCDYFHRGCQEYICLEELDSHVVNCGFAPVKCSNEECEMIVNKREIINHERVVCEYRKVKCHKCVKMEQNVEEMKEKIEGIDGKMEVMKEKMEGMKEKIEGIDGKIEGMDERIKGIEMKLEGKMDGKAADVDDLKRLMIQMFEKLRYLESNTQISSAIRYASNAFMEDILIPGGWEGDNKKLKSVERFSWKKYVWERVSSMNVDRVATTSFVYDDQVFVAGGCRYPVIEVFNLTEKPLQWKISQATLPFDCSHLHSVVYQNCAILFCACRRNDRLGELCLTSPYTCKQFGKMPYSPRIEYAVVAFEHKVLVFGGSHATNDDFLDHVFALDLRTKEYQDMPSLPFAVSNMAGVRWRDQAVLIGGFGKDKFSKRVFMYDSKTGNISELPSMLEKRSGCAAVITENTIVVMGGRGESGRVRSVEAFTLGCYSWRYLPSMNYIRSSPTAIVLPTKNFQ